MPYKNHTPCRRPFPKVGSGRGNYVWHHLCYV